MPIVKIQRKVIAMKNKAKQHPTPQLGKHKHLYFCKVCSGKEIKTAVLTIEEKLWPWGEGQPDDQRRFGYESHCLEGHWLCYCKGCHIFVTLAFLANEEHVRESKCDNCGHDGNISENCFFRPYPDGTEQLVLAGRVVRERDYIPSPSYRVVDLDDMVNRMG